MWQKNIAKSFNNHWDYLPKVKISVVKKFEEVTFLMPQDHMIETWVYIQAFLSSKCCSMWHTIK